MISCLCSKVKLHIWVRPHVIPGFRQCSNYRAHVMILAVILPEQLFLSVYITEKQPNY